MTVLTKACPVTIVSIEAAGDGGAATAAQVDLPTTHTVLLVRVPSPGPQAIKLPEGNAGDLADIFFISGSSTGAPPRLVVYDADENYLVQTDSGRLSVGQMVTLRKILAEPYSIPGTDTSYQVGTWIGGDSGVVRNYPPST
jgi:hypothetical protein